LVLIFKVPNLRECNFVTIITVAFLAHWFNKHAVVLLHGRERWGNAVH